MFYHIISGQKDFYFVEPTQRNLKAYEAWSTSSDQANIFFPDMLEPGQCSHVHLVMGNTMIIPTGWIHAVYTPVDTMVIGGNFLHGMNIKGQLDIYNVETVTNVPLKFRYYATYNPDFLFLSKFNGMLQEHILESCAKQVIPYPFTKSTVC